jgi:acyl dehydratase
MNARICFNDLPVGLSFRTAARTILDADIIGFAGLSGDFNALHVDDEFARGKGYGGRIAHGMLVASIVSGLRSPFDDMALIAFLETSRQFVGPVFPGDTIFADFRVSASRLSAKDPHRGIVTFDVSTWKRPNILVQRGVDICLVENP